MLVITNKSDVTSDFIIKRLNERAIRFYRFNTDELTLSIDANLNITNNEFYLIDSHGQQHIRLLDFSAVYFRRPEMPHIVQENLSSGEITFLKNELTYSLEGIYKILKNAYWVSPLFAIREAENKVHQLITAKSLGFRIPETLITNSRKSALEFFIDQKKQIIAKPLKSGLIEELDGSKIVFTTSLQD
ncbi:MAG TPA: hypothetical protein VFE57_02215, partial [Cyclobacteriaceae bacterium]|nr:hypothetical protein [Cyclobacteriaceae bacterium]